MSDKPTYEDLERRVKELEDIIKADFPAKNEIQNEQADKLTEGSHFFENLEKITLALNSKDENRIVDDVLDAVFSIFKPDRIWLFYPCDPEAPTFKVLSEKSTPDFPGAFTTDQELPLTPEAAVTIQKAIDSGAPTVFGPESGNELDDVAKQFSVQSQMIMAIHPKHDKPWMFGMHQCAYARIWTNHEQSLFREISNRIVDALSSIILLRELEQSEKKYRRILDNASAIIFIKDIDAKYLYVNRLFEERHGITNEMVQGLTDHDLFPDEMANQFRTNDLKVLETNSPINIEETVSHEDGFHSVISTKFPLFDNERKPYAICGIATDITDQKIAEDALKESEERFALAMEFANDGLFDWNLDKNEIYYSPGWKRMLGYEDGELPNDFTVWETLTAPADVKRSWKMQNELINKKRDRFELEFKMKHKNGHWVDVLSRANAIFDKNNKAVRIVGTHVDISERKKLESQLLQSQKLESIGNLAGGIAHEFNNILSIIIGNNELIMEDLPRWSLSRENCEEIRVAGLRARDIVKHLLTFSRQDDSVKIPIDIRSVVKESLKLIRSTTPTNIEIRDTLCPDCLPILGDATQINQILINLCSNAVDVLPISGGRIDIELCNSDINHDDSHSKIKLSPGKYVKLLVRDNGSGIDKSIRDRIFEPYFTTKDVGKGSGIGLAVVHGIVENHGGSIVCDSNKNQGTTFTILVPAHEGPLEKESDEKNIFPGNGEKILYVDDEPSIAKLGRRHLEALGYDAYSTTDPKEALKLIKAKPDRFDLVISDMAMPNMPGDQLITEILSINPEMPTMIISGYSSRMSETKASEMGIKAFVMKPLNKIELARKVMEVLDGRNKIVK